MNQILRYAAILELMKTFPLLAFLLTMHELSIAYNLVTTVEEAAREAGVTKVDAVYLRLGALSNVAKDALLFGYELAAKDTLLEGSTLHIEDVPVLIYCPQCHAEKEPESIQMLRCPTCNTLTGDIRQGKELELVSLEYTDNETTNS